MATLQDLLKIPVVRGFLQDLEGGRNTPFLFNPAQFRESYKPVYARLTSPGLSHRRMQFSHMENAKIPLRLIFDQAVFNERKSSSSTAQGGALSVEQGPQNDTEGVRRRFLEMVYPRRSQRIRSAAPPPLLFYWPEMIAMRVRITNLQFGHILFTSGTPLPRIMTVDVDLEEEPMSRIYSEDQFRSGTFRPWAASSIPRGIR